jgi:hypothetical protein
MKFLSESTTINIFRTRILYEDGQQVVLQIKRS